MEIKPVTHLCDNLGFSLCNLISSSMRGRPYSLRREGLFVALVKVHISSLTVCIKAANFKTTISKNLSEDKFEMS